MSASPRDTVIGVSVVALAAIGTVGPMFWSMSDVVVWLGGLAVGMIVMAMGHASLAARRKRHAAAMGAANDG